MVCNNNTDLVSIGKRIKEARKNANIKQEELAQAIGCKREVISYYEKGSRDLKTEAIIKISQTLNVSADYLLGLSDNPTTDKDLSGVCKYTGLSEEAVEVLAKLNSYKMGDYIETPGDNGKSIIGQVVSERSRPSFIISALLENQNLLGHIYAYFTLTDIGLKTGGVYVGDIANSQLFEVCIKLREMRNAYKPLYEKELLDFFGKGADNGEHTGKTE